VAPDGAQSITTNGTELVVGTKGGGIRWSANLVIGWTTLPKTKGWAPAYPG
jgi:hypothetical protein